MLLQLQTLYFIFHIIGTVLGENRGSAQIMLLHLYTLYFIFHIIGTAPAKNRGAPRAQIMLHLYNRTQSKRISALFGSSVLCSTNGYTQNG